MRRIQNSPISDKPYSLPKSERRASKITTVTIYLNHFVVIIHYSWLLLLSCNGVRKRQPLFMGSELPLCVCVRDLFCCIMNGVETRQGPLSPLSPKRPYWLITQPPTCVEHSDIKTRNNTLTSANELPSPLSFTWMLAHGNVIKGGMGEKRRTE